jgi:hypothetical protein
MIAQEKYEYFCTLSSDINEHMPILKKYAKECEHVTELGVRGIVSTWAFLAAKPKKLVSVDIVYPETFDGNLQEVYDAAKEINVDFKFILGDDLKISLEETDLLFIDTLHTMEQLNKELSKLGSKAKKYIILHDTYSCRFQLGPAINVFLAINSNWKIHQTFINNNGLTILKRIT